MQNSDSLYDRYKKQDWKHYQDEKEGQPLTYSGKKPTGQNLPKESHLTFGEIHDMILSANLTINEKETLLAILEYCYWLKKGGGMDCMGPDNNQSFGVPKAIKNKIIYRTGNPKRLYNKSTFRETLNRLNEKGLIFNVQTKQYVSGHDCTKKNPSEWRTVSAELNFRMIVEMAVVEGALF